MTVPHYCVIRLGNMTVAYNGQSVRLAAVALKPGTVFGRGNTPARAEEAARMKAREVRRNLGMSSIKREMEGT